MAIDGRWSSRHGNDDLKERQQTDTEAAGLHFLLLLEKGQRPLEFRLPVDGRTRIL